MTLERPFTPELCIQVENEIRERTAPVLNLKRDILNFSSPQIFVYPDQGVVYKYDKETKKKAAECDRIIEHIAEQICKHYGLPWPPVVEIKKGSESDGGE